MINHVTFKDRLKEIVPLQRSNSGCREAQPAFRGDDQGYIGTLSRSFSLWDI
jgi:hypothetical protein